MNDTFSPEARAELLAMYTGMAMQGLLAQGISDATCVAVLAVDQADATVTALEAWHSRAALLNASVVSDVSAQ